MHKTYKLAKKHFHLTPGLCKKAYLFKVFPSDLIQSIGSIIEFDKDITAIILMYLPDRKVEEYHKRIQKYLQNRRKMITYWHLNLEQPFHSFSIQYHERSFVQNWFRLIMKIEQHNRARSVYDVIIELISRKTYRMLIVTNEYIIIDDIRFDLNFPRTISLW